MIADFEVKNSKTPRTTLIMNHDMKYLTREESDYLDSDDFDSDVDEDTNQYYDAMNHELRRILKFT